MEFKPRRRLYNSSQSKRGQVCLGHTVSARHTMSQWHKCFSFPPRHRFLPKKNALENTNVMYQIIRYYVTFGVEWARIQNIGVDERWVCLMCEVMIVRCFLVLRTQPYRILKLPSVSRLLECPDSRKSKIQGTRSVIDY